MSHLRPYTRTGKIEIKKRFFTLKAKFWEFFCSVLMDERAFFISKFRLFCLYTCKRCFYRRENSLRNIKNDAKDFQIRVKFCQLQDKCFEFLKISWCQSSYLILCHLEITLPNKYKSSKKLLKSTIFQTKPIQEQHLNFLLLGPLQSKPFQYQNNR